jgi:Tfp pilus assembly protein PilO
METRTRKLCITLAVILVIALIASVGFWLMIRRSIDSVYAFENAAKDQDVHHDEGVALKTLLTNVSPDLDVLKTRIIESDGTVPFINSIEALAHQAGAKVNIDSVDVHSAEEGDTFERLGLTVSTQGSWNQVYTFLAMIESLPYKVSITSVGLNQDSFTETANASSTVTRKTTIQWKGSFQLNVLKKK